ncbi:MAG TPA: YdiU family protein [Polyangiaceae bacterium]|nr:YdiU family protein [Polyangiaceae bacterium]
MSCVDGQSSPSRVEADASFASSPLEGVRFDNRLVKELPGDRSLNRSARTVHNACYSSILPVRVAAPKLVACAQEVADLLGLPSALLASPKFVELLAGNTLFPGMDPFATCYGGHQFGGWAGQLGDGRAITLAELLNGAGERFELQLKGAGRTPYSRAGDGRAVLRSSIREFLASEAMHHLGIPTTRALALVTTGERVVRDMLYDGNPSEEAGAIVCRVARSFLRFGNFELFSARDDGPTLQRLADYTLASFFSELGAPGKASYGALFHEVCRRTAAMVAHWMRVGFVHGVMNTDNMSILGLTIDYGPYGFLDHYERDFTPNTSDVGGRYRYAAQPSIAKWNLLKLAESLFPLVQSAASLQQGLALYEAEFSALHRRLLGEKLGLFPSERDNDRSEPTSLPSLLDELFALFETVPTDFTLFFRALSDVPLEEAATEEARLSPLAHAYYSPVHGWDRETRARLLAWLQRYAARVRADARPAHARRALMHAVNPKYILRNYQAQLVIEAAERGDYGALGELLDVLRRPYDEQPGREHFAEKRPDWARERVGCSQLSCSS